MNDFYPELCSYSNTTRWFTMREMYIRCHPSDHKMSRPIVKATDIRKIMTRITRWIQWMYSWKSTVKWKSSNTYTCHKLSHFTHVNKVSKALAVILYDTKSLYCIIHVVHYKNKFTIYKKTWNIFLQDKCMSMTAVHIWRPLAKRSKFIDTTNRHSTGDKRLPVKVIKYHVDRQTGCEVMAIFVYSRWPSVAILDFWNSKIAPLNRPFPKTPPQNQTS